MPPPGYYPPPSFYGPTRLAWKEGNVIPAGYSLESRPRTQVLNAGLSTFAPLYGLSVLFASVYAGNEDRSSGYYLPMYVPVLGPFITLGTANTDGVEVFMLLLDGVGQATGAAMIIAGALGEEKYLLRKEAGFDLRPEVFVGPRSAAFRWKF